MTLENVRVWAVPKEHENMPGMQHLVDVKANAEAGEVAVSSGLPRWIIPSAVATVLFLTILIFILRHRRAGATPGPS